MRRGFASLAAIAAIAAAFLSPGVATAQGDALAVILTPKTATNPVDSVHCVTADVVGATEPVVVVIVVKDAVTQEVLVTSSGLVVPPDTSHSFCYQGPPDPRVDQITAFVDENENDTQDVGEPFDATGSKAWIVETAVPGQAAGGGHIAGVLRQIGFSFSARATETGVAGTCRVFDPDANVRISCIEVSSLVIVGTHAILSGAALFNDEARQFEIDVNDLGEPGAGRDTFTIRIEPSVLDPGYFASGILINGNVSVRAAL